MFSGREMPSPSSIFSTFASMAASCVMLRTIANQFIPHQVQGYLVNSFRYFFNTSSPVLTFIIDESNGFSRNQVYDAAEVYLSAIIGPQNKRLKISQSPKEKSFKILLEKGEKLVDNYDGIELKWSFNCAESGNNNDHHRNNASVSRYFELSFHRNHREKVINSYLPFIFKKAKDMKEADKILKMHTLRSSCSYDDIMWDSVNLDHPSTFDTLAMEAELKNALMEDLDRFVRRKEFYKRVGRAWKRGYLLYGPPGTGKSSLVAAMANYLKFDIYDLQLENITKDSDLRRLLLSTRNRSIIVIEDIDCTVDLPDRHLGVPREHSGTQQLTLSGLLNFIDGLWSSFGDERIIIFTTNHKEKLDAAMLRPGRMDMHIHMSYCSYHGFKLLASNYLGVSNEQHENLFTEIKGLIENTKITPAQVAEELMKNEDAKDALEGFVGVLKRKKMEGDVCENDISLEKASSPETKRRRVDFKQGKAVEGGKKNGESIKRRTRRGKQ